MSMKDSTRLLLKATPELLEGWCGPVVWDGCPAMIAPIGRLFATESGKPDVYYDAGWPLHSDVYLDLARAECRDRVARALGVAQGLHHEVSQWHWLHVGALGSSRLWATGEQVWMPCPPTPQLALESAPTRGWKPGDRMGIECKALATLDPHDDTRLPDGSRLVDALALHAAATEVFGG